MEEPATSKEKKTGTNRAARIAVFALVTTASTGLLFFLLEGGTSLFLFTNDVLKDWGPEIAEVRHTVYDQELGWVGRPNVVVPDLYGPGRDLRTESHGFRGATEVSATATPGISRLVCSGDSFTLGYGVADDQTWCYLLAQTSSGLETVNMGQGGYGIGQAYLWYMRDGIDLAHDVQIFAFITFDFNRMQHRVFLDLYPKPMLQLDRGELAVTNVPVPQNRSRLRWRRQLGRFADELGTVRLFRRIGHRLGIEPEARGMSDSTRAVIWDVADRVFTALHKEHSARNRRLVLAYLPQQNDYLETGADWWRARIAELADREDILYVDLIPALRQIAPEDLAGLFIGPRDTPYRGAAGHYNELGNEWVARELTSFLQDHGLIPPG